MQFIFTHYPYASDKLHDCPAVNILHSRKSHKMVDPTISFASVFQYICKFIVPFSDCLLEQFNICIVFSLIREKFFLCQNSTHQIFIEFCLKALGLCYTLFIYSDLCGIFLCQFPVDPFLTDTGQQGIQRSNIFNMSFQTVLHTFNQIRLFQHDRRCAAILFAGRAVIIVILFIFIAVRLAGHTAATASADQNTGKQVNLIRFGRSPCVNPAEPLHQIKIVLLYDRFMGSLHTNPFRRRFVLTLF